MVLNRFPHPPRVLAVRPQVQKNAFTEADGKAVGDNANDSKALPTERCAFLMHLAQSHQLAEAWISNQPILLFLYMKQYAPVVYDRLYRVAGPKRVAAFKNGSTGYGAVQNPIALIKSLFGK